MSRKSGLFKPIDAKYDNHFNIVKMADKFIYLCYQSYMANSVLYLRNIDEKLKRQFKALCVMKGKTLTEEIQRLMREELERKKMEIANEKDEAV